MAMTPAQKAKLKKELSKGGKLDKAPARKKSGASVVSEVAKRYKITAREARDIATAIGTGMATYQSSKDSKNVKGPSGKNFIKQVKETAVAAATGKKGTTSDKVPVTGSLTAQYQGAYTKGKKRK